jgi:hypothetical protein
MIAERLQIYLGSYLPKKTIYIMKKNYFINAMLVLFITVLGGSFNQVSAQNYFYVGTATTTTSSNTVPFYTWYQDKRTSYMILASELQALGASGNILSLAVDVSNPAAQAMNGFNVKMGQTTATSMTGFVSGLTNVYSAPCTQLYQGGIILHSPPHLTGMVFLM